MRYLRRSMLALMFVVSTSAPGQISPSRSLLIEPIQDTGVQTGPLPRGAFTLEMYRGWGSYRDDQAWQLRLHGLAELWRINSALTLAFTAHHELTASPFAEIGFNPRTARWEEQFHLQGRASEHLIWTATFFHRCKHDIDNNEPPDDDTSNIGYRPTRRAIILTGPRLGIIMPFALSNAHAFTISSNLEYYVVSEDYRTPGGMDQGSWKDMEGAFGARVDYRLTLAEHLSIGANAWASVPWFSARNIDNDAIPFDARAEVMLSLHNALRLDVVFAVDHQFDEVVFIRPEPTTAYQVGLRIGGF